MCLRPKYNLQSHDGGVATLSQTFIYLDQLSMARARHIAEGDSVYPYSEISFGEIPLRFE